MQIISCGFSMYLYEDYDICSCFQYISMRVEVFSVYLYESCSLFQYISLKGALAYQCISMKVATFINTSLWIFFNVSLWNMHLLINVSQWKWQPFSIHLYEISVILNGQSRRHSGSEIHPSSSFGVTFAKDQKRDSGELERRPFKSRRRSDSSQVKVWS